MIKKRKEARSLPSHGQNILDSDKLELVRVSLAGGSGLREVCRYIKDMLLPQDQSITKVRVRLDLQKKSVTRN